MVDPASVPPQDTSRIRPARYLATPWSERRLYRPFVRAALLMGLFPGFALGAMLLDGRLPGETAAWRGQLTELHGVAQVFGWAGLFIIGIAMHLVPRVRGNAPIAFPWPQRIMLALILVGIIARTVGQLVAATATSDRGEFIAWLLVMSGVGLVGGIATFVITLARVLMAGSRTGVAFERWVWAGLSFALVAAVVHLGQAVAMTHYGGSSVIRALGEAWMQAGLFGFIGNFVFGLSLRAVAGFLRLRPAYVWFERSAFAATNVGIAWVSTALVLESPVRWTAVGVLIHAIGILCFVVALRIFERPAERAAETGQRPQPSQYPRFGWFLRFAYGWLVVAAILLGVSAVADFAATPLPLRALPILHTYTVGFVTMMIFGFSVRVLPLLEGRAFSSPWLADAAFVLTNLSVALRLVGGVFDIPGVEFALRLSGIAGLASLVAFMAAVWPRAIRRTV